MVFSLGPIKMYRWRAGSATITHVFIGPRHQIEITKFDHPKEQS